MSGNGPGGLKVGDLYVSVTAAIGEAVKNLSAIVKKVEEAADAIEEHMSKAAAALGDFSDGLLSVAALAAGAFAVASQTSEPAKKALEELTESLQTLGKEVGSVFIPLVKEMTVWVKTAVATWRNLTAGQKEAIVTFVKYATVTGVASKSLERTLIFTKSFAEGTVVLARVAPTAAQAVSNGFTRMRTSVKAASDAYGALGKRTLPGLSPAFAKVTNGAARASKALEAMDMASLVKRLGVPARASIASLAKDVQSGVVTSARATASTLAGLATSTPSAFKAMAGAVRSSVVSMSDTIRTGVTTSARAASSSLAGLASSTKSAFASVAAQGGVVSAASNSIRSAATAMASGMTSAFRSMGRGAANGVGAVTTHITSARMAVLAFIKTPLTKHLTTIGNALRSLTVSLLALPKNIGGMFAALRSGFAAIAGGTPTIIAVAAALAGIVLLAGSLYKSWGDITYLWKESTAGLAESMQQLGEKAATFFGELWAGVKDFIVKAARVAMSMVAGTVRAFAMFLKPVTTALRMENATKALAQLATMTGDEMLDKLLSGMSQAADIVTEAGRAAGTALADATKGVRGGIAYGLKHSVEGAKELGTRMKELLPIDQLLGLKDALFGSMPTIGDPNTVEGTKTLKEAEKESKDALKAVREITGNLFEAALLTQKLAEQAQQWLASNVMAPQFELLFRESLAPAIKAGKEAQQAIVDRAKKLAEALAQARDALVSKAVVRTGEVAGIVESGVQGATVAGPLGAVAAVLGDLLTRSESFKTLIEMVNSLVQQVADALGQLVTPLRPLIGGLFTLATAVVSGLAPALTAVGQVLQPLAPLFQLLGTMLAPLFQVLGQVLAAVVQPIKYLVEVALKVLFDVFKTLGLTIMNIVLGLREAWNGIVWAVQSVLRALGDINILGGRPLAFLSEWADGLEGAKTDTTGLRDAINQLHHATYETAMAQAQQASAVLQATAAVDKMTASLTNATSTWKYALRSFEAQNARPGSVPLSSSTPATSSTGGGGGAAPSSPAAPAPSPAPSAPVVDTINVYVQDENAAMRSMEERLGNLAYRTGGTRGGRGRKPYAQDAGVP